MNYRIEWDLDVLRDFTATWERLDKPLRETIMGRLDAADQIFRTEPWSFGESRGSEDVRVALLLPLVLTYEIDKRLGIVRVVNASIYRKKH